MINLIRLEDGTLVEVAVPAGGAERVAGGVATRVGASLEDIKPILLKISHALRDAWEEINTEMLIEEAEVEMGLSFEGEGNVYVAKAKAGANLTVKLKLKPVE
jgi:hypothetical protein